MGPPLSSGLSVPDLVDRVILSVVEIRTSRSGGTGFLITDNGVVVTNEHVVADHASVKLRLTSGREYVAKVADKHPSLDLAYLNIQSSDRFTPIAIGNSAEVRVGEEVIAIGFPLGSQLGQEPTVSRGIVSAIRQGVLQTDAPVNPGNSGGPLLDRYGNAIGVVTSRIDESQGRSVSGIGFAIPINEVQRRPRAQVTIAPPQLTPPGRPTIAPPQLATAAPEQVTLVPSAKPVDTPLPTIPPTFDLDATKAAIDAEIAIAQTKVAREMEIERQQQEAEAYARSAAATAQALIPTPTPVPTPTPTPTPTPMPTPTPEPTQTPLPTPTPHPGTYCKAWEGMVLDWIKQGNHYHLSNPYVPTHDAISRDDAEQYCIKQFPDGRLFPLSAYSYITVGTGKGQLLPGLYKYHSMKTQDGRVDGTTCEITLNRWEHNARRVPIPYGEEFEFRFLSSHGKIKPFHMCDGFMYRIGD